MFDSSLGAAFAVGLLGSAHCVGMCGGFVALLGSGTGPAGTARQAGYFAGKTATYAAFGAVAGTAGDALGELFGAFGGVVGVGLGLGMVALGAGLCGAGAGRAPGARAAAVLGPAIGRLVRSGSPIAVVALGALNGLLPCGLVYGMLTAAAATGSAASGAATMAVFGLATLPALALTGLAGARLRPRGRLRMQRLAGVLVVVMGLLTVARGAAALASPDPDAHRPHAETICGTGL